MYTRSSVAAEKLPQSGFRTWIMTELLPPFMTRMLEETSQTSPMPSPSLSVWATLATNGQLSQTLPKPSPSVSSWSLLATVGQLSQALPKASPSVFAWSALATVGQLSTASRTPSRSTSMMTSNCKVFWS